MGYEAVILAGGLGLRLRSVVSDRPKVMAEVAGEPFLERQLRWFERAGVHKVVVCTGYMSEVIKRYLEVRPQSQTQVCISEEQEPLGTAGAVRHAAQQLAGADFFAANGDSYIDVTLGAVVEFHRSHGGIATLVLIRMGVPGRYGVVNIDDHGRLTGFRGKSARSEGPALVNAGLYLFRRDIVEEIPPTGAYSLEHELFPRLVAEGKPIFGFPATGRFIDIGEPADFARAQIEFAEES